MAEQLHPIEAEIREALSIKPKKNEERRAFINRIRLGIDDLDDDDWEALSPEAQEWTNKLAASWKSKNKLIEFPVVEEEDDGEEDDGEEEEEAPKPKKGKSVKSKSKSDDGEDSGEEEDGEEEEEEAAKPKKKGRGKAKAAAKSKSDDSEEEEEEEEAKPKKGRKAKATAKSKSDDDDEGEAKPKKGRKAKKSKSDDDDDDEEAKPKKAKAAFRGEGGLKERLKLLLIDDVDSPVDELCEILESQNPGIAVSRATVSGIRAEFRHTLRVLQKAGHLKGISI